MIWIECATSQDKKRVIMVKDPISIGRKSTCDFYFPDDPEMSRVHAIVELRGKFWYLADQKSTNGSFVNGQRVTVPFPLKDGDMVEIGVQRFRIASGLDFSVKETKSLDYAGYPHLYVLLRLATDATPEQIDLAKDSFVKIYDPELHPGNELVKELLQDVLDAHQVLSDPTRKAEYDATIHPFKETEA